MLREEIEDFLTKITTYTDNLTGNEGLKTILSNLNEIGVRRFGIISLKVHIAYDKENIRRLERGKTTIPISTKQAYIEVAKVYKVIRRDSYNRYLQYKYLSNKLNYTKTRTVLYWFDMKEVLGIPLDGDYCFRRVLEAMLQKSVASKIINQAGLDLAIDKTRKECDALVHKALDDIKSRLMED